MKLNLNPFNKNGVRALIAITAGMMLPHAVFAEDVTLKSSDGTVNIVGEFVDFVDDHYVIRTALGDLRITASRVRCEGDACPVFETTSADIKIAGSDTVGLGLMPLLMAGYASHLDAEASVVATETEGEMLAKFIGDGGFGDDLSSYLVTSTSSGDAFTTLKSGTAEIGMASRRIKPQEARDLKASGAGNMVSPRQEHIVAVDSLVVVTHPSNPVDILRKEQIRDIYSGKVTNWSEVGGDDLPITVLTRQEGSGTRSVFEDRIFLGQEAPVSPDAKVVTDSNAMAALVNDDAGALGFVGYAFQRGAKPLTIINHCGMTMIPDAFSAKTEEYALQRRMYLYTREDSLSEEGQNFMDYVKSSAADGVIAKSGFIDLGIRKRVQSLDSPRALALLDPDADRYEAGVMREMLTQMTTFDRLSTTFRFRTGSSQLDERGELDMSRLADYLEKMPEGTKVKFVGFTDSIGAFDSNRSLSIGRAGQVQAAMTAYAGDRLDHINMSSNGFGEVSPAACNTDDYGRSVNRRVEVWIGKDASS